jgi:pyruvate/2-oxoglutarate dehydrogenase complex dihydrolipoamide dehydrogenase (E3) component
MARRTYDVDLALIGGGTAGLVGAQTAAGLGARVVLIEERRTGGDCLYTGCVPSKALLAAASAAASARGASRYGVDVGSVTVDFPRVLQHVRAAITHIEPVDSPEALAAAGVDVLHGRAGITPSGDITVAGRTITARHLLVATGSDPAIPAVPGLGTVPVLTNENLWDLDVLPEELVILGGGPVGCELGQAFARLGSRVTMVHRGTRLLPREDPEASSILATALQRDGVRLLLDDVASVVTSGAAGAAGGGTLETRSGHILPFTHLLAATGRIPRSRGFGLEQAGVALDDAGHIITDRHLRTSSPRIWAAGDVTAYPKYTHTAGVHASIAAGNAILGPLRAVSRIETPRVTFTDPEIAAVGSPTGTGGSEETVPHTHQDRAVTEQRLEGFTRLVFDGRGRITGGTIVGPRAGESLGEVSLAVQRRLTATAVAGATHPYPTHNDGVWNAAIARMRKVLGNRVLVVAGRLARSLQQRRTG